MRVVHMRTSEWLNAAVANRILYEPGNFCEIIEEFMPIGTQKNVQKQIQLIPIESSVTIQFAYFFFTKHI